ncbi:MAG: Mov34/MPN/PAD-1 family protein [Myxococcota bacterium]
MALTIRRAELEKLWAHAREGYPHEVVGILAGSRDTWNVSLVVSLVNERADSPKNRYQVSGLVLMRAEEKLAAEGLEVVGYYHSHPDHPSRWSDFDRDHALPNMSYVIASVVKGDVATTQSWRLREDRGAMDEEEIRTED